MRRLAWIVTLPLTLVIVVFAVANRQTVTLDLWPLEMGYRLPLFALVLACLLFGFVCGIAIMWLAAGKTRHRARESHYRASSLEREVAYLKRKQHDAAEQAATAKSPGATVPSARLPAVSARR